MPHKTIRGHCRRSILTRRPVVRGAGGRTSAEPSSSKASTFLTSERPPAGHERTRQSSIVVEVWIHLQSECAFVWGHPGYRVVGNHPKGYIVEREERSQPRNLAL